ncbi:hypothetical protein GGS20DRAFT_220789 [Poronia punctata]|nr:hypothetical protein GGS20DRAFT_220789 [Poronia punctata]
MLFAVFFAFWRFLQIVTLIPTIGLLAYFVDGYNKLNALTPNYILILFIVSVLAGAWAIFTIFAYHRSSTNASFVAFVDLLFVGAFIAAVYQLRFIAYVDCTSASRGGQLDVTLGPFGSASLNTVDVHVDKWCAMLKASFAFGIMNSIFFFITSILAWMHGDRLSSRNGDTYVRETHVHRHGNRSAHSPSRHGSSHHSHRRAYV